MFLWQAEQAEQSRVAEGDDPPDPRRRESGNRHRVRAVGSCGSALVHRERGLPSRLTGTITNRPGVSSAYAAKNGPRPANQDAAGGISSVTPTQQPGQRRRVRLLERGGEPLQGAVWLRSTVCLQRSGGKWLITHEHISLPVGWAEDPG